VDGVYGYGRWARNQARIVAADTGRVYSHTGPRDNTHSDARLDAHDRTLPPHDS